MSIYCGNSSAAESRALTLGKAASGPEYECCARSGRPPFDYEQDGTLRGLTSLLALL